LEQNTVLLLLKPEKSVFAMGNKKDLADKPCFLTIAFLIQAFRDRILSDRAFDNTPHE
jgi:hypothetical protein